MPPMVMRRRWLHYLYAFLLLVAQQGALTHAMWHSTQRLAHDAPVVSTQDKDAPAGKHGAANLCALDALFVQVLGGAPGTPPSLVFSTPAVVAALATFHARRSAELIVARSRDPPVIL